jgi:dolichol-phosphate mannosyltransferase
VWRTFARFNVVGGLGIAVQLATLAVLVEGLGVAYRPATLAAVGAAIAHNFVWHQRWTWRGRAPGVRPALTAFGRFVAANGLVSITGNVAVMAVLTGQAGVPALPANAVSIAMCGLVNFWLGERVVFRRRPAPVDLHGPGVRHCSL